MNLPSVPLAPLAARLRSGAASPSDVAATFLYRVRTENPAVKALLEEDGREDRVLAEAAAVKRRWASPDGRPRLFGVPVGIKDLIRVDGLPTRGGSALPAEEFAGPEAAVVNRLRELGAIVIGKTATDEFAYADPPETRNPHDPARTPGGSSAGSAAGVAAGLFPLGIGTQTSRSIIAPAAFCGVVGFKPSHGSIPLDGVFPLAPSLDTVGILAQDVPGVALAAEALLDGWTPAPPRAPVFGVPAGPYLDGLADEGWRAPFEKALEELRSRGRRILAVDLGWDSRLEGLYQSTMRLLNGEFAASHARLFEIHGALYRRASRSGVEAGRRVPSEEVDRAREAGLALRRELSESLKRAGVDILLSPSQLGPAPLLGGRTGWGAPTALWSYAGMPCLSIPWESSSGLPIGFQLIGAFGADSALLSAAAALESEIRAT
ncbi:MAG: amidase [Planctomycetes bacterium]|nr:amidase [Planctomycetota bacterium]